MSYISLSSEEWRDAPEILRAGVQGPQEGRAWYRMPHNAGFEWLEAPAGAEPGTRAMHLTPDEARAAQAVASWWEAVASADEDKDTDEIDFDMSSFRPSADAQVRLAEKKALKARQDKAAGKAYLLTLRETLDPHAANRAARDARLATK